MVIGLNIAKEAATTKGSGYPHSDTPPDRDWTVSQTTSGLRRRVYPQGKPNPAAVLTFSPGWVLGRRGYSP